MVPAPKIQNNFRNLLVTCYFWRQYVLQTNFTASTMWKLLKCVIVKGERVAPSKQSNDYRKKNFVAWFSRQTNRNRFRKRRSATFVSESVVRQHLIHLHHTVVPTHSFKAAYQTEWHCTEPAGAMARTFHEVDPQPPCHCHPLQNRGALWIGTHSQDSYSSLPAMPCRVAFRHEPGTWWPITFL